MVKQFARNQGNAYLHQDWTYHHNLPFHKPYLGRSTLPMFLPFRQQSNFQSHAHGVQI